ncbi:MAG: glycosyltransferase family 2 protein [Anaerolineae bacterium]|nr:glycosyltransferase family 2 protein [Anaerolineae bacterium]
METPKVTVITPAYNGADHIGEAIQSVLGQTYSNVELIVVDDFSTDNTAEIVAQFDDSRLLYLAHEQNRGVDQARMTGLAASTGEIIAFLDQDDYFHPEKLATHVNFLQVNPDVGFTYNSYFNLNHSAPTIRDISRPPQSMTLIDLVRGFPLPPSVMVMRREWALRDELWDEATFLRGREIVFCGRLFLAGCKFALVDRMLNYRRYHAGRLFSNLAKKCADERACQEILFADTRFPKELLKQRDEASANIYMLWAYVALAQGETAVGQDFVRHAVRLHPGLVQGVPCELTKFFLMYAIDEELLPHEELLCQLFAQFPPELGSISDQWQWAAGQGSLIKGIRSVMWGQVENGRTHFDKAVSLGAQIESFTIQVLTTQLIYFESEFGMDAASHVVQELIPYLKQVGSSESFRAFRGNYAINRAFRRFEEGQYTEVPKDVLRAVLADPNYLANRGVLSILLRSSFSAWARPEPA